MGGEPEGVEIPLAGGNMSEVKLSGMRVKRTATPASATIQRFLRHLKSSGVDWVPDPQGFDESGREVLSYIPGEAVDGIPPAWFWEEALLLDAAQRLRLLHDASTSFDASSAVWNWEPASPAEVILHRDFAPYNCIFREGRFVGLIDFDLCAPGPRIWDIAYTAYRFVPLMPKASPGQESTWSLSPFDSDTMLLRLEAFLDSYGSGGGQLRIPALDVLETVIRRLDSMIGWILESTQTRPNAGLSDNVITYSEHRSWLDSVVLRAFC